RPTATPYVATVAPFWTTRSSRDERLTRSAIGASFAPDRPVDNQATPDPIHAAKTSTPIHLRRFDSIRALHVPAPWKGKDCAESPVSSGPNTLDLGRSCHQALPRLATGGPT